MKTRNIRLLAVIMIFTTLGSSCSDFLDESPKTKIPTKDLYKDVQTATLVINGLYSSYNRAKAGRDGFTFTLLGTDEVKQGIVQVSDASQSGLDKYDGNLNATSSQISSMWSKRWAAVNTAAEAIKGLELLAEKETSATTLAQIKLLRASACFIRAMSMFEMTMYWGEIPVIEVTDLNNTKDIDRSKQPLNIVWKQIHDDLDFSSKI